MPFPMVKGVRGPGAKAWVPQERSKGSSRGDPAIWGGLPGERSPSPKGPRSRPSFGVSPDLEKTEPSP